jgi:hypothetical protein
MQPAELIHAALIDARVRDPQDDAGPNGVYCVALPGLALPLHLVRHYKAPQGLVHEKVDFVDPSGDTVHTVGPQVRKMVGEMDVTRLNDLLEDAHFEMGGIHLASFTINGALIAQVEFEVVLQAPRDKLPPEIEKAIKATDVAWVGVIHEGRDVATPSWFVYRNGRIYVLSDPDRQAGEQFIPGIPDSKEVVVIIRREKGKDTALTRFMAAVRVISPESPEFDQLAPILADRRRSRFGSPEENIAKWKQAGCVIGELIPAI